MEEAQKQYKLSFEQRAAQYLSMGYAQWLEKSREQFVTGMKQWEAEHGRITRIRFHAAYNTGLGSKMSRIFSGEWQLEFDLWFTASESSGEGITLWIHDGKVTSIRDLLFSKQQPAGPVRNPAGWYYELTIFRLRFFARFAYR